MTPRNIFNKGIQDLYTESHTTLLRKIEDDLINGEICHLHGL